MTRDIPRAYYNEIDKFAAAWLRNLIAAGHIMPGDVDERDIRDVTPQDLEGYTQCHFFAGIGGWSLAARNAGWPDDRPLWTGSCPCQPFSEAGHGKAFDDHRHLWPEFYRLISQYRPAVVFGEQVTKAIRWGWLDLVANDMERADYAIAPIIIPACAVGSTQNRKRIFFCADAKSKRWRSFGREQFSEGGDQTRRVYERTPEPDIPRSIDAVPDRMALVRAFGNAIVPQVATEIIGAYLDAEADQRVRLAAGVFA